MKTTHPKMLRSTLAMRSAAGPRAWLAILIALAWSQSAFSQPDEPIDVPINADYSFNPEGSWWLRPNYVDMNGGGIDAGDWFLFHEDANGNRIELGDPSIFRLDYAGAAEIPGGPAWFFCGTRDDRNLWVYRTRDFRTFDLHMTAFDDQVSENGRPSGQYGPNGLNDHERHLISNNGTHRVLKSLWAGQLYQDPDVVNNTNPLILLTFSAIRFEEDSDGNATGGSADMEGWRSIFQARIRRQRFDSWFLLDPHDPAFDGGEDGPRFQDPRSQHGGYNNNPLGYHYVDDENPNQKMYDGGHAIGRRVPSSIKYEEAGNSNPGSHVVWPRSHAHLGDPLLLPGRLMFPTALSNDPYIFYDPNGDMHMLYNWDTRKGNNNDGFPATDDGDQGRFLGAFPMVDEQRFDPDGEFTYIGVNRNSNNTIPAWRCHDDNESPQVGTAPNGATKNDSLHPSMPTKICDDAVAEQPSVFYNENNRRYYVLYSRNYAFSSTYQIVYRMTAQDADFEDLDVRTRDPDDYEVHPWLRDVETNEDVKDVTEFVLLESDSKENNDASFGNGDVFSIEAEGNRHYYLLFHCKMDGSSARTPMVKELTFDDQTGEILQLTQELTQEPDARAAYIFEFRWPKDVAPASLPCHADLTTSDDPNDPGYGVPDGAVDSADFFYYLDLFSLSDPAADLTGSSDPADPAWGFPDGSVDADDYFFYLELYSAGCPG